MSWRFYAMVSLFVALLFSRSAGQVPHTLSYQGVLTDSLGHPKPDGSYNFGFRLYASSTGGSALWTETKTLPVSQGLFTTTLGDQVPIDLSFDGPMWLSIQVSSDPELSPRIPLASTAYSLHALRSDTALYAHSTSVQASADSARIAGTVPNNSLTAGKVQAGQLLKSLNGIKDSVTLASGSNITITSSGHTLTFTGTGGFSLPFKSAASNSNTLLSLTNSGTGGAASFTIANNTDTSAALRASTNGQGSGIYAETNSPNDNTAAVVGVATATSGGASGLWGDASADPDGAGVSGSGGQAGGFFYGGKYGVFGSSMTGVGVEGVTNSTLGGSIGILGIAATSTAAQVIGVQGSALNNAYGKGVQGKGQAVGTEGIATEPSGKGVRGEADGTDGTGVEGDANNGPNASGILGYSANGYGGYFIGKFYQTSGSFEAHPTSTIWSTNKPATVKLRSGAKVKLFSEESAEVYFNDYGEAALQGGKTHIALDPTFLETVTIDNTHPMKVFVQLEGDCRGVYVTNRSATGFDVVELQGGKSNAEFAYRVVCKRKYYEDERLATDEQDVQFNKRALETAWPEVIERQRADVARLKRDHVSVPERVPAPNAPSAKSVLK